jgi:TolB-like protein/DNA-binding winged helix-turn-helix (wHTH) protein
LTLRIGDWEVSTDEGLLQRGQQRRRIAPREMEVLGYLAEHHGEIVGATTLLDEFWPNPMIGDHAVHKVISELRHALNDDPKQPTYLETIPKRGYRLMAAVCGDADLAEEHIIENDQEPTRRHGMLTNAVAALLVVAALLLVVFWDRLSPNQDLEGGTKKSVAVLRFTNIDGNPDTEYLVEGIAEALLNGLAQVAALDVAAKTDSFAANTATLTTSETGRLLGVEYLLEGSVQLEEELLRTTVQLIRVADGFHLYSEQFDRPVRGILALQDHIADKVVTALRIHLDEEERAQMLDWGTTNVEAYLLVSEANYDATAHGTARQFETLEKYREAILLAPTFLDAYRRLAENLGDVAWYVPPKELDDLRIEVSDLRDTVEKLDPEWTGLLPIKRIEARLTSSMRGVEASIRQLLPHDPRAYYEYGRVLRGARDGWKVRRCRTLSPISARTRCGGIVGDFGRNWVSHYSRLSDLWQRCL